ncbi:hypothetical protein K431DRAFT_228851 [Polychaeton citri CBS 116435]|uniref:Uncharacterized protein n=1 Tax=Polychaeton citri CBS 116435 TaxID=1314669 RepID=A0A9P4UKU0_9PEZI|nr:hypothetical protein K431DRAFT_228851 [Polychaeton citri CBS 116435]
MLPPPRATSNTYQQHYSPVNSSLPKPPVPIRRSSQVQSETETDTPISTDVLLQQIELLQLSLLHQTSTETLLEYESSAFGELAQRHASLRKRHENLKDIESKQRKLRNIEALNAWCNDQSQFNESLAILCRVIQELCVLSESNSKFDEVVLVFSEWIGQSDSSDALLPLQQDWRASHASLALKLRSLQRLLQNLPPVPSDAKGTSLWRLSRCCSVHVDGMLRELDVLGRLERQMLKSHKARLDREIERYILTEPPSATQTPNDGSWIPMWETDGDP